MADVEADVGRAVEPAQRGEARGDGERVARQGPGLVDVAGRGDPLHQLAPAAVGRGGEPAADHLAHHGQVGLDAEQLLRASPGDAEAADHLVEDQQRAGLGGGVPTASRNPGAGGTTPMLAGIGSAITAAGRSPGDRLHDGVGVVPGDDHGVRRLGLGDARAGGHARGREARAGLGEQAVDVAVVGAGELDDRVAAGGGPGEPHRADIVASVPELVMRTISTLAKRSITSAASSTSPAVGAPKLVPRAAAVLTASTTTGSAWPRISGPQEETQST